MRLGEDVTADCWSVAAELIAVDNVGVDGTTVAIEAVDGGFDCDGADGGGATAAAATFA